MRKPMLLLYAAGSCGRAATCCPMAWRWSCCTCPPRAACPARAPRCCLCTARTTGPGAGRCVTALFAQQDSGRGSMVHRRLRCSSGMSVCDAAAPCLQERWMSYFAAAGYDCCALLAALPWLCDSDALSACDAMLLVNHLQAEALLEAHLQARWCSLLFRFAIPSCCLAADAVSLRGQGRSDRKTPAGEPLKVGQGSSSCWSLVKLLHAQPLTVQSPSACFASKGTVVRLVRLAQLAHPVSCCCLPAARSVATWTR